MARLIDEAVAHFSNQDIRTIDVPEWNTKLYAKRLTLEDKSRWAKRADGDATDYLIYACIYGLHDEKGEQVFSLEDKIKLKKSVDPEVLTRLGNFALAIETDPTELYFMYELASRLGQPLSVIQQMTVDEFNHWWTFYRLRKDKMNG